MSLIFRFVHKNFVEKLKIMVKNSENLNCFYGQVLHDFNALISIYMTVDFFTPNFEFLFYISIYHFFYKLFWGTYWNLLRWLVQFCNIKIDA